MQLHMNESPSAIHSESSEVYIKVTWKAISRSRCHLFEVWCALLVPLLLTYQETASGTPLGRMDSAFWYKFGLGLHAFYSILWNRG